MKHVIVVLVLVLVVRIGFGADQALKKDIRLPEAPAKTVNLPAGEAVLEKGVEFAAAGQLVWAIPAAGGKSEIALGLKVTNKTGKAMQLSVFDTVRISLKDAAGKALQMDGGRNGTRPTRPLIIANGDAQLVARNAKLEWLKDGKTMRLIGDDGAGGIWYFDGLTAGKYTLGFTYECDAAKPDLSRLQPASAVIDATVAPFWSGKATTKELTVEVAEVKVAALPASEAVLENGAEFAVTGQTTWALPGPATAKTPIKLGLKVTNKTEKGMLVNVFDTVMVEMRDAAGKGLAIGGGRKATFIPEPLLINAGESKVISRDAQLEWTQDGTYRLSGADGAGGMWTVEGIKAGRYTLVMSYAGTEEMLRTIRMRDAKHVIDEKLTPYYLGKATTKGLEIEVAEVKTASAAE